MKIFVEMSIEKFNAWSGAIATKEIIIKENKVEEFNNLIEECYPEGVDETTLNDLLWFDDEWIFESLGINIEE